MVNHNYFKSIFFCILSGLFTFLAACGGDGKHQPVDSNVSSAVSGGSAGPAVDFSVAKSILQNRCVRCHASGELNWNSKEKAEAAAKRGAITRVLSTNYMPLKGSPESQAITDGERAQLLAWAKSVNGSAGAAISGASAANSPNVIQDRNLSVAFQCMACHGPNGISIAETFPNLAGHDPQYIFNRLTGFLKKDASGIMPAKLNQIFSDNGILISYDPDGSAQINDEGKSLLQYLANYFGWYSVSQSPAEFTQLREKLDESAKTEYLVGKEVVTQRCLACHLQNNSRPIAGAAMIFGQKASYLAARLEEFSNESGGTVMPAIVSTLSEEQKKAVVTYLSLTHPDQARE